MLQPNHPSNLYLVRPLLHVRPTLITMPDWTSVLEASGIIHRMHSLMYGFSTLTLLAIVPQMPSENMSKLRKENMVKGFEM